MSYTIELVSGAAIIRGKVPLPHMSWILTLATKEYVIADALITETINATMVLCTMEKSKAWRKSLGL